MADIVERLRNMRTYGGDDYASMDDAADEIERNRAAIAELVRTGQAVLDRWDSPAWKDLPNTGKYMAALRTAIIKHTPTTTKKGSN